MNNLEETFVIKEKEDILRVREGAKGVLTNGNSFEVWQINNTYYYILPVEDILALDFFSLKGATVTQKGDNNE